MKSNLFSLLGDHPAHGSDPLVHDLHRTLCKDEVLERVDRLSKQLTNPAGTTVAVVAEGIDMLVGMFAVWKNNQVFVPVNPRNPRPDIDFAAVVSSAGVEQGDNDTRHEPGVAFVLWTSGTTGQPKPVLHTHESYLEIIDRVLGPLRSKPRDPDKDPSPNLIPVSLALNAGFYNALFGLRAGAPLVMMDRFSTADFATLVSRHSIRSTVLPPAAMAMLNDDPALESLSPLRYVRSITAPLSPFHARRFNERFGVIVLNGYGQAEIGEVIGWTAADAKQHPDKIGAVGRPHPGVQIRVDSAEGSSVGELLVLPPSRADGYADGSDLSDRITDDGYVRTGDLARIDAEGFVWIEGRLSEMINRGGNKVYPTEVEEVLLSIPGIREAAVVAVPDDRLGELPVAFVAGDANRDLEAVCREHLIPYKVPARFEWVEQLPRNDAGKVLRRELAGSCDV